MTNEAPKSGRMIFSASGKGSDASELDVGVGGRLSNVGVSRVGILITAHQSRVTIATGALYPSAHILCSHLQSELQIAFC